MRVKRRFCPITKIKNVVENLLKGSLGSDPFYYIDKSKEELNNFGFDSAKNCDFYVYRQLTNNYEATFST